ncbi:MAG: isoprenoid biosynthesis protein ElbB, partial [Planctomycetota bacterium]
MVFAPDVEQSEVVDHYKGEVRKAEHRNVLAESARIARGHIHPLSRALDTGLDGVIIPGGYGA